MHAEIWQSESKRYSKEMYACMLSHNLHWQDGKMDNEYLLFDLKHDGASNVVPHHLLSKHYQQGPWA